MSDTNKTNVELQTNIKGSTILDENINPTPHVNDGDNLARQPDRRDQQGHAFDGGLQSHDNINVELTDDELSSEKVNDKNRYDSVTNAQKRSL